MFFIIMCRSYQENKRGKCVRERVRLRVREEGEIEKGCVREKCSDIAVLKKHNKYSILGIQ